MLGILDVPKPLYPRSPQTLLLLEIPPRARTPILVSTTSKSTSNTVAVNKNRSDGSRVMKVRTKDSKGSLRSASMENAARRLGHFRSVSGVSASTRPRIAKSDDANASYHELASTSEEEQKPNLSRETRASGGVLTSAGFGEGHPQPAMNA